MKWARFAIAPFIIGLVVAFGLKADKRHRKAVEPSPTATPAPVVMTLNNGVVYFELTGDEYIKALQAFYEENPTLHCDYQGSTEKVVETPWADGKASTLTTGHILHCHDIAIPAQDVTVP